MTAYTLREAEMELIDNEDCKETALIHRHIVNDGIVCATPRSSINNNSDIAGPCQVLQSRVYRHPQL